MDAEISFAQKCPITCIVGLNASGKSSLIQAIDFIGQLMRGGIDGWLNNRKWKQHDLASKLSFIRKRSIEVDLECVIDNHIYSWEFSYNINRAQCTKETVYEKSPQQNDTRLFHLLDGRYLLRGDDKATDVGFTYQGSLLSQLKEARLEQPLVALKKFIASIYSFDMLSPRHIRGKSKKSDTMGQSGEHLAGYLYTRSDDDKTKISENITALFPWVENFRIKNEKFGWKELLISESIGSQQHPVSKEWDEYSYIRSAQHASDGTLRLMALFGSLYSNHGLLLFDEIENGLNPHIIERVVRGLLQADKQLVVTTHSPEFMQYFPDDLALDAMKITLRNKNGSTRLENFFDLPETKERLKVLGPGEVFLDLIDKLAAENEARQN